MRALETLHNRFEDQLEFVHAARWRAIWRVVEALLIGRRLWLTALGRALPGDALRKHAIKAVDRLLGNKLFFKERFDIARGIASIVIPSGTQPLILVDLFEIRHRQVAFTASVAHDGRSLPIWSTIVEAPRANAATCRRFLSELARVLPECRPILITDAGFESAWLLECDKLGWDYVCRVRGQTKFLFEGKWVGCADLRARATNRAKNLGQIGFPQTAPTARRLVLSRIPTSGHRRIKTRRGPGNDTNYRHFRKNAHEPLLVTTSLSCRPGQVVNLYKTRMQIEQSFRDLKNHRWGWSLRHCRSRSKARLELLLIIASIAMIVQQLVGAAGEKQGLGRRHQANTHRHRVLSLFTLGGLLLNSRDMQLLSPRAITNSLASMRRRAARLIDLAA